MNQIKEYCEKIRDNAPVHLSEFERGRLAVAEDILACIAEEELEILIIDRERGL